MWCPPHARAHGHELGTEADPSAGNALTDGSSTAGSECTGQSCVLVMPSSVVPDKGRGRTGSKISSRGPTRRTMRQGWKHDCDLNLWSVQETQLEINYLQYRTSPRKQQGYCWGDQILCFGIIWRVPMSLDVPCIYIFICMGPEDDRKTDQLPIFPKDICKQGLR